MDGHILYDLGTHGSRSPHLTSSLMSWALGIKDPMEITFLV